MTATISSIGEAGLIGRIKARNAERAGAAPDHVLIGIGDDAAVLEPPRGALDVVTTDCLVEGVHFRRDTLTMRDAGRKALAVNLSDLASMGAEPRAATLSLALPADLPLDDFDALVDGFLSVAADARVPLVGGNISASPGPVVIDVTLIGAARRRRILTRGGGKPGHLLYVTGTVGRAAFEQYRSVPEPRLRCGIQVARNRAASACMDLSDGLADAVRQIAAASGTGAAVLSSKLPVHSGATLEQALRGGEDYELLFAVPARRRRTFEQVAGKRLQVTAIGELTAASDVLLVTPDGAVPLGTGFQHF